MDSSASDFELSSLGCNYCTPLLKKKLDKKEPSQLEFGDIKNLVDKIKQDGRGKRKV